MGVTVANGQLPASAGAILSPSNVGPSGFSERKQLSIYCQNTSSSTTETVVLTLLVAGGTARRIARAVLAPNEQLIVQGVAVDPSDSINGVTTDANTVDYFIQHSLTTVPRIMCLDANGALKQVNTGISGNQTVSGNLTVGGNLTMSATNGITAHSGGGQTSGVLLTSMINRVTTVAAGNDSVDLPVSAPGLEITVTNAAASS